MKQELIKPGEYQDTISKSSVAWKTVDGTRNQKEASQAGVERVKEELAVL